MSDVQLGSWRPSGVRLVRHSCCLPALAIEIVNGPDVGDLLVYREDKLGCIRCNSAQPRIYGEWHGKHAGLGMGRPGAEDWVTSLTFSDIQIHGSGELAWATSAYSLTTEGVPEPDTGKQLVVLQRQADGSWLTLAVSVSSDLPPPEN